LLSIIREGNGLNRLLTIEPGRKKEQPLALNMGVVRFDR